MNPVQIILAAVAALRNAAAFLAAAGQILRNSLEIEQENGQVEAEFDLAAVVQALGLYGRAISAVQQAIALLQTVPPTYPIPRAAFVGGLMVILGRLRQDLGTLNQLVTVARNENEDDVEVTPTVANEIVNRANLLSSTISNFANQVQAFT